MRIAAGALAPLIVLAIACSGDRAAPTAPSTTPTFAKVPATTINSTSTYQISMTCSGSGSATAIVVLTPDPNNSLERYMACGPSGGAAVSLTGLSSYSYQINFFLSGSVQTICASGGTLTTTGVFKCRYATLAVTEVQP